MINPYHIQPGLLLDVDITSIKRKKATLDGMANVLNEFLHGVSKGFQDAAFASFSRRRSTVREDIDQHFATDIEMLENPDGKMDDSKGQKYIDMLNNPESATTINKVSTKKPAKKKGVVDSTKKSKRGRPKKKGGSLRSL